MVIIRPELMIVKLEVVECAVHAGWLRRAAEKERSIAAKEDSERRRYEQQKGQSGAPETVPSNPPG